MLLLCSVTNLQNDMKKLVKKYRIKAFGNCLSVLYCEDIYLHSLNRSYGGETGKVQKLEILHLWEM